MAKQVKKCPVSTRAIIQRINRKLKPDLEKLCKFRGNTRGWNDFGDYYILDLHTNGIANAHVDIEKLARQEGILKEWEAIVDD